MNKDNDILAGFEYTISDFLFLRTGYNEFQNLSFGFGFIGEVINFDYAFVDANHSLFNHLHQYNITLNLDGLKNLYEKIKI